MNDNEKGRIGRAKKSDKPFVIGFGIFVLLFFFWIQYSYTGDLNQTELITVHGKLNSELIQKSTGGTLKTYYWVFSIKNQPVDFSIKGVSKSSFDSGLFKKIESNQSEITVKVDKLYYEKLLKKSKRQNIGIKYLASNNQKYFELIDFSENRQGDKKISYLFLIFGIGSMVYGWRMKK